MRQAGQADCTLDEVVIGRPCRIRAALVVADEARKDEQEEAADVTKAKADLEREKAELKKLELKVD